MGEKESAWRGYVMSQLDAIERLLRKIAPQYGLVGGDIVTYKGVEGSAGTPANAQRSAAVQRDWASLPAIQRTAGEMPLVAAPGHFVETLPGSHGLPPIVEPLGHEVSPLATPGLVVARTRAIEAPAPGAIPAPAPVQRRPSRTGSGADAAGEGVDSAFDPSDTAPPIEVAAPVPQQAAPAPARAPASAPIRTMPTVSRQAINVPDRPLTSAAAAAQPAAVQRAAAGAAPAPAAGTPALPRPSGGMRRVPSPTPVVPQVSREVAEPRPAATPSPVAAPSPAAAGTGPSRRGLGEPLASAPASAKPVASVMAGPVVSRSTTSGPLPIAASSLRPVAQRSAAGDGQLPALGPGHAEPPAGSSPAPIPQPVLRLPHLPVSRAVDDAVPAPTATVGAPSRAPRGPEVRPTTGAHPLRPSPGIQRVAADDLDDGADAELPSPWWSPDAPAPAPDVARSVGAAEPLGTTVGASIQRSAIGGPGAATARPTLPARADRAGQAATAVRSAPVASPGQRVATQATRPSPLPQPAGAGMRVASSAVAPSEAPIGATAPTTSGRVIAPEPVVQTSPATAPAPGPAPASPFGSSAVVQREEGSAPAAPAQPASGAPSERDLDELAQALFGRIRGRLRNDLIYDREAKGLTFDNV